MDLTDPDNHVLADKPIEHARELARAMIEAELEAREVMAERSKAISKIIRHLNRKDVVADAPALSREEELEVERDIAHLDTMFPRFGLADLPLRQRLEAWKSLRKLDKGKRGTGAKELRPGIGAAAFALHRTGTCVGFSPAMPWRSSSRISAASTPCGWPFSISAPMPRFVRTFSESHTSASIAST